MKRLRLLVNFVACVGSQFTLDIASASSRSVYEIGNSLTADVYANGGFAQMVQSRGHAIEQGHSIRWGMGLATQWADYQTQSQSTATTSVQGGFFQDALTTHAYDAITLQPFANSLSDEMPSAQHMIEFARTFNPSSPADLYLYAPWPGLDFQTGGTVFGTAWQDSYPDPVVAVGNFPSRDFFRKCYQFLKEANPQNRVFLIPTGEVFADLSATIAAGNLPGISLDTQLYNDSLHASLELGRFVAGVTWYATLFRDDPHGLEIPAVYQPTVTPQIAEVVYDAVWRVLTSQANRTNLFAPGDVSGDGIVNFDDLLILAQHFDQSQNITRLDGDIDENGIVNFDDLLILSQHYSSANAFASGWVLAQSIVPEPTITTGLLLAGLTCRRRSGSDHGIRGE